MNGEVHIGTSGWSYKDWKEIFYPKSLKSTEWLSYYAITFRNTEINSSFYHLPRKTTVENWTKMVPGDFFFCPKMSRYLTHIKRLKEPEEPLQRFFQIFEPMQSQMGPVLIQLPPSLKFEYDLAAHLYQLLQNKYNCYRFALEGRHSTWLETESLDLMMKYNIAFVISQSGHGFPYGEHITAKDIYFRFHGPKELFASLYPTPIIKQYARLFEQWRNEGHNLWIFFNNDFNGYAIHNALTLQQFMETETQVNHYTG
jgi:uncharacterized protein YecE (DUF72 family)